MIVGYWLSVGAAGDEDALFCNIDFTLHLVGCGALLEATDQDRENRYNAAVSGCGQMQSDPVLWAQCQTEAENLYWAKFRTATC